MAALSVTAPQVNIVSEGPFGGQAGIMFGPGQYLIPCGTGAPTGGAGWAGPGSIAVTIAGAIYTQTGTLASLLQVHFYLILLPQTPM